MIAEVSATIKAHKNHDAPWLVFKGAEGDVQQAIIAAFGFDATQAHGLTLAETVQLASSTFQGVGATAVSLGAVPMTPAAVEASPAAHEVPEQAAAPAEPEVPASPNAALIEAIGQAGSLDDIQKLWLKNQAAFNEADVQQAVTARRAAIGA